MISSAPAPLLSYQRHRFMFHNFPWTGHSHWLCPHHRWPRSCYAAFTSNTLTLWIMVVPTEQPPSSPAISSEVIEWFEDCIHRPLVQLWTSTITTTLHFGHLSGYRPYKSTTLHTLHNYTCITPTLFSADKTATAHSLHPVELHIVAVHLLLFQIQEEFFNLFFLFFFYLPMWCWAIIGDFLVSSVSHWFSNVGSVFSSSSLSCLELFRPVPQSLRLSPHVPGTMEARCSLGMGFDCPHLLPPMSDPPAH